MKRSHKIVVGIVTAAGLGLTAAALYAQPGPMGGGMGPGVGHGMMGGMGPGMMQQGGPAGPTAGQQLMTPEERAALQEKMRNAKTPEERQKLAEANRAEMEKRAKEKGITLPEHRGPHAGFGPGSATQTR
jgi:Spy/CpxP family protein refolding chaperone